MEEWGNTCLACRIIAGDEPVPGGVIHQEDFWEVRLGHGLLRRGWTVVASRIHHPSVGELSQGAQDSMGRVLTRTAAAVKHAFGAEMVYVCTFGETVAHVHFHIIPCQPQDVCRGPDLVAKMFRRKKPRVTREAAEQDAGLLRTAFVDVVAPMSHLPPPAPLPRDRLRTAPDLRETGPRLVPRKFAPYDEHDD